ncbi:DUF2939 domain-containing protein [Roseateles sp. SL47]|uniref:DUF2939 domain-containing protein n=1 Tax=Roseateles sp. SL47 TaxID=2995138 RepID=UPI00226E8EC2|nr:DUF2939 domain-containing protein [Roseateles sp. SL47]WAC70870.1 DUF2939 domain-containing protein [Roseateles sp. SL47]
MTRSKWIQAAVVAVVVVVGGGWFASPYLAVHQMREAAKAGDTDRFNAHVDYPRLRDNLKAQLTASFKQGDEDSSQPGNDFKKAAGAFGRMLGTAMAEGAVEALVRPEVVMRLLQQGQWMPKKRAADREPSAGTGPDAPPGQQPETTPKDEQVDWWTERPSLTTVIFHARRIDKPQDRQVALVFEQRGWVSWQLTDIQLPRQ